MKAASVLLLVLVGPLPFWALGAPWVMRGKPRRIPLAPLIGCALAGLYAELAMILGLPVRVVVGVVVLVSAAFAVASLQNTRAAMAGAISEWTPLYLFSVLAASISPFPDLGEWSGDWHLLYNMGQSVLNGELGRDMLARPPLFGAAATPLWILADGLIPYQLMAAVASASAVTAMLALMDHYWPKTPRVALVPLLLSPFFLHHTAAAWGKLLAAGLILTAILEAVRGQRLASAALYALSMAVHEGSLVWAPCVLAAHAANGAGRRGVVKALVPMAVCGLVIVAPLQVWILVHYGLGAKLASNPVVTERLSHPEPFWVKTALAVVTMFVGWAPVAGIVRWLHRPGAFTAAIASREAYWLILAFFTTIAGTMVGVLFPFLTIARRRLDSPALRQLVLSKPAIVAVGITVLFNSLIVGAYSLAGSMQGALSALALGWYALAAGALAAEGPTGLASLRKMSWMMAIVGTLPWLVPHLLMSLGLWASPGFRRFMLTASEGDYFRVLDNHLISLGMGAFPVVPVACIALLGVWAYARRRQSQRAVFERKAQA